MALLVLAVSNTQAAGWTTTDSMSTPRMIHTATLLTDGRVLVTGGYYTRLPDYSTATTEIYDPATATWTPAASMGFARVNHAAVLLADGRVLVSGGNAFEPDSAEIFNPATNTWAPAASMAHERFFHSLVRLGDGRVLAIGGASVYADTEVYDPVGNTWSAAGSLSAPIEYTRAVALADGSALNPNGYYVNASDRYNVALNAWQPAGAPQQVRGAHDAVLLADGRVMMVGGSSVSSEIWNPSTNSWSVAADAPGPRLFPRATLLSDGRVLVTAGQPINYVGSSSGSAFLYNPSTDTWSTEPSMTTPRYWHTATRLNNGQVLVTGGFERIQAGATPTPPPFGPPSQEWFLTDTAELYDGPSPSPTASPSPTPNPCPPGSNTCAGSGVLYSYPTGEGKYVPGGVEMSFSDVYTAGTTTVTSITGPGPPYQVAGTNPSPFYNITTTAVFLGSITICMGYDDAPTKLTGLESDVQLMHWNGTTYVDITNSRNTTLNFVCGITTSLSPFVLVEGPPSVGGFVEVLEPVTEGGLPMGWLALAAFALGFVLAAGAWMRRPWGVAR